MGCNMGLGLAFPTIVIPSVIGVTLDINPDESLHMTPDEASWLGKHRIISGKSLVLNGA